MDRLGRRKLLKLSGAAAVAARTGGIAAILAAGRAPAYAQGASIHWLRWNDFIPASDELLKKEIAPAAEKALGFKLNIETINGNDLQARTTSAIQSGSGPDVICGLNNWPQLYAESVADVSDLAEEIGKGQGGFYEESKVVANDGKKWIAVPWCVLGAMIVYRKSWFEEIGLSTFPESWEQYYDAGKKLKAKGHPLGQTLGHTFGDAPTFTYPYLWSWGGKEVEADGKTVVLDSTAAVDSVKFMKRFWTDACDEGGLAWDDTSNNRAFLSGTISATLNGASIYLLAKIKPDTYQTEKGSPMFQDMAHSPLPRGPAGQFGYHLPMSNMLMGYSKNQKPAREFIRWITSKEIYQK
jgi:multiple sugar transport system substrate-binding protein